MNAPATAAPNELERLTLAQDQRGECGIELCLVPPRHADKEKPWRLTLFNNAHGCIEASFSLTVGEAEAMRDWLNDFLARQTR